MSNDTESVHDPKAACQWQLDVYKLRPLRSEILRSVLMVCWANYRSEKRGHRDSVKSSGADYSSCANPFPSPSQTVTKRRSLHWHIRQAAGAVIKQINQPSPVPRDSKTSSDFRFVSVGPTLIPGFCWPQAIQTGDSNFTNVISFENSRIFATNNII